MINEPTTAHEQVRALAAAVRDGELTPEQREHLVDLLHSVGTAVALARRDRYPDNYCRRSRHHATSHRRSLELGHAGTPPRRAAEHGCSRHAERGSAGTRTGRHNSSEVAYRTG
jgi:hypothetical protein